MSVRKAQNKMLRRVCSSLEAGSVERFRRARWRYLTSPAAKCVAAEKALRKAGAQVTEDAIRALAAEMDAYSATGEPVYAHEVVKPSGGTRTVCDFGLRNRAVHYLLKPLLEACGAAHGHQYGFLGRSRDDLANYVKEHVEAGYCYAVTLDIANCFGSFNGEAVADRLPLPRRVVDSHVTFRQLEIRYRSRRSRSAGNRPMIGNAPSMSVSPPGTLRRMVFGGIPQGSAVSNLVAASLLADLIDVVPFGTPFGQYGDDIISLAKTEAEACTISNALRSALEGHPSGSMRLKSLQVSHIADGFEYLGYHFRECAGEVAICPKSANMERFRRRWIEALRRDYEAGRYRAVEALNVAQNFIHGVQTATGLRGFVPATRFKADHVLLVCQTAGRKPNSRLNPLTPVQSA